MREYKPMDDPEFKMPASCYTLLWPTSRQEIKCVRDIIGTLGFPLPIQKIVGEYILLSLFCRESFELLKLNMFRTSFWEISRGDMMSFVATGYGSSVDECFHVLKKMGLIAPNSRIHEGGICLDPYITSVLYYPIVSRNIRTIGLYFTDYNPKYKGQYVSEIIRCPDNKVLCLLDLMYGILRLRDYIIYGLPSDATNVVNTSYINVEFELPEIARFYKNPISKEVDQTQLYVPIRFV